MNKLFNPIVYRFDRFCINISERKILKDGNELDISSTTFDVLLLLVKKCGETVTKEQFLEIVWNGSFVEEKNITVQISKLRKLLRANKSKPFIKTIARKGYQFVTPVHSERKDEKGFSLNGNDQEIYNQYQEDNINKIAVLPFSNENGNAEMDYLADGLTESIIIRLSYLDGLKVLANDIIFRYKSDDADIGKIGEQLHVSAIIKGRIRTFNEYLAIGVELINVKDGTQLWGMQVNQTVSNIFDMQEEITVAIANEFKFDK